MAVSAQNSTERVVVLLRPQEKKRLERLARKERVSSAEIVRRSLAAYSEPAQEIDDNVIAEMNAALDKMKENIHATNLRIEANLASIQKMRAARG